MLELKQIMTVTAVHLLLPMVLYITTYADWGMLKMTGIEIIVRMETFFGDVIEPNNITSNECVFRIIEHLEDGLVLLEVVSEYKEIIYRVQALYQQYDYNIPFVTEEEKEIVSMKNDTLSGMEATTEIFELVLMQEELVYSMQEELDLLKAELQALKNQNK